MRAILFDCDGTLADSFGIIVGTMRETFRRAGLPVPDETAVHGVIGLSLDLAIHRLTPTTSEADLPALVEAYRGVFHELRNDPSLEEALFPGIEPLLRRLAAREDILLGMVTGKSRRGVRIIVEKHGLEGVFRAVRTADDCPSKPHPAMVLECCAELGVDSAKTIVVGDAIFDMAMAVAAGARALGVSWGASSPDALTAAGAERVVADAGELSAALDDWMGEAPAGRVLTAAG